MKIFIKLIVFLMFCFSFGQKNTNKIKVYVKLEIDDTCFRKQKFFSEEEQGIIFNNQCKSGDSFLFKKTSTSDTICITKLKKYKISSSAKIKEIEKKWRKDKFTEVQQKNKREGRLTLPYHTFDKNYIFETYLIEKISDDKFVVYPVIWRGQNVKQ
ncbi:hypothetical protein [Flavobacterium okayamense]|nr:hypothetical protein [Flavobacterium okayamense]